MTEEMNMVINRLQALSPEAQKELAPRFNDYLNKLDTLKAAIQEGVDSGQAQPLTRDIFRDVITRGQQRHSSQSS